MCIFMGTGITVKEMGSTALDYQSGFQLNPQPECLQLQVPNVKNIEADEVQRKEQQNYRDVWQTEVLESNERFDESKSGKPKEDDNILAHKSGFQSGLEIQFIPHPLLSSKSNNQLLQ